MLFLDYRNYIAPLKPNKKYMKAFVFPGQGSQFPGMAADLYDRSELAKTMLNRANEILGFQITEIMFRGSEEELKQTKVTQPAIFLHSVVLAAYFGRNSNRIW